MKIDIDKEDLLDRVLRYVQIDTQSDPHSSTVPSTAKQWDLIHVLEKELNEFALQDVHTTEFGYVLATIPGNSKKENVPQIAFLAHVDTSDACLGKASPLFTESMRERPLFYPMIRRKFSELKRFFFWLRKWERISLRPLERPFWARMIKQGWRLS